MFSGFCRVHQAPLRCIRGEWEAGENDAQQICLDLADIHLATVAEAHYTIGDIRRLRGDLAGADEAYQAAHRCGKDPQPGMSLLRLAQGRPDMSTLAPRPPPTPTGTGWPRRVGRSTHSLPVPSAQVAR